METSVNQKNIKKSPSLGKISKQNFIDLQIKTSNIKYLHKNTENEVPALRGRLSNLA